MDRKRSRGEPTTIYNLTFRDSIFGTTPDAFRQAIVEDHGIISAVDFYTEGAVNPLTWMYIDPSSSSFLDILIRYVAWEYPGEKIPQESGVAINIVAYPREIAYLFGHIVADTHNEKYIIETYFMNRWGFAMGREMGSMYVKPEEVPQFTIPMMKRYACPVQIRVF